MQARHFFVAYNIAFSTMESSSFKEFVEALRPAFVSEEGMPNRQNLWRRMLDDLNEEVRAKFLRLKRLFLERRKDEAYS